MGQRTRISSRAAIVSIRGLFGSKQRIGLKVVLDFSAVPTAPDADSAAVCSKVMAS
jgi:hypothetical protein